MKTFDNLEDFDKYHPIPRELGKYNYIYGSGGKKDEVYRHFIVPKTVYESYKSELNIPHKNRKHCFGYFNDDHSFCFRKNDEVNMISPLENSYGYKMILLTYHTSSNPDNRNCELRNKRKILKQFTTQELDIVEEELKDIESTEDERDIEKDIENKNDTKDEVEDDADDIPHN